LVLQHADGPRIEFESAFLPAERSQLQDRYREQLNTIAAMPNVLVDGKNEPKNR